MRNFTLFLVVGFFTLSLPNAWAQSTSLKEQFPALADSLRQQQKQQTPQAPEVKVHPWSNDPLIQKFLRDYFVNKPVYLVPKRLQELINYGYMDQEPSALSYLIGFLGEIFNQNEDKVLAWVSTLDITQYQAGGIIRAMRHAQMQDKVQEWLTTKPGWIYRNNPSFHNLTPLNQIVADELEDFEILTGAYAASGDEIYIRRFAEALTLFPNYTPEEVGQDAEKGRTSIISQGLQEIILILMYAYPQAKDQMENIIASQPMRTQQILRTLINRLQTYQGPSSEFQGLPQNAQ